MEAYDIRGALYLVIQINKVTKKFHTLVAINELSMEIRRGEVLGILGPNGAGKTTLFKIIAGFLFPEQGGVEPLSAEWPVIGYKPERLLFPGHMRVRDYLHMAAELSNLPRNAIHQAVSNSLHTVQLTEAAEKRISDCSKGMRQRLGMAQAIIGNPPLLLLDEPSNGLDPEGQADICRLIKSLHANGKTIVLASHQLEEVTQVCSYLVILNHGSIHYQNDMADALALRPHCQITADRDLRELQPLLESLHPDLDIEGRHVILNKDAIRVRRQIMSVLIAKGFDITHVEQSRVTLAEIYAEAVQ